ncbi:Retinoic acid induced 16-like protein-domain-containing protein [Pseudomassariella vexata]|uniref:Retinoic acid induced 16-like protein-domain-containing protein n=1 Tax=Pseudomassariella vexata TaxID=1141098 RepID=A0A1Y2EJM5_9PEZI|nr:Retinoic acid induced 16-like protein-domain-containing protein [Pseudomassariella vexata]ORY71015.1 Retinoic acid induced 16-like protein-domain-containing protein [Pseudomassariella vexata]
MDFWSRILAHTPLSGSSSRDAARDPVRRRHRFEKEYSQLLQTWRTSSNLARDIDAAENIEIRLQEMTNILADESRRPLPHPCISFSAAKEIYVPIAKIATTSYNEWIIKEAVLFFATLIESEEEAFVENDAFSASLTNLLVRITGANSIRLGSDTEIRVVELAFNITTKIRLEPHILPAWFKSHHAESAGHEEQFRDQREKFAGKTQKQDFPLFYLLMDYIHHEGKTGDFARTGLLYIIESASSSVALEQWIVESDLSTLMATGLGALYSQLSRKLVIDHPPQDLPPVLALSDYQHPTSTFEIVSSCSPDFQLHLETFLSHLLFWQDVLNHCRSTEVKSTLLEHFQVIFLQQLLYPSLLESSDVDGGSSVAVLTYLRRILESLDHPDMINLILHYLLALPDEAAPSRAPIEPAISAARKRKSMDLATMMATKADPSYTPLLFNLVDLIHSSLKSRNQQTVCVTLQLLAAILKRHHRYAIITLLRTEAVLGSNSHRTRGAHEQEVEYLTTLAASIGGQDNFDQIYESILKDTTSRLEGHPCSLKLVAPKVSTNNHKLPAIPDSLPGAPRDVPPHTLSPEDPLLNTMLDLLDCFFVNPVETNLSLTETIIDLAVCGYVNIEGWLLRHPNRYVYDADGDESSSPLPDPTSPSFDETEKLRAMAECRRRPQWQPSTLPRMLSTLNALADQVASFRGSIPRFDDLLQQRREAFQTADTAVPNQQPLRASSKTVTSIPDRTSLDGSRPASPVRPTGIEGFAQRLLSELGTPSRSGSPKGRKEMNRSTSGSSGMLGGYGLNTPSVPPKEFSVNPETPNRSGHAARSFSPDGPSHGSRDSPVASQMAAFAAIDQSILARRVGLPPREVEPIPLNFEKASRDGNETSAQIDDGLAKHDGESQHPAAVEREALGPEAEQEARETVELPPRSETATPPVQKVASVSHVITNVIVLQSFLLELASLVQVRAGMFSEVRFA